MSDIVPRSSPRRLPWPIPLAQGAMVLALPAVAGVVGNGWFPAEAVIGLSLCGVAATAVLAGGLVARRQWALIASRVAALGFGAWCYGWAFVAAVARADDAGGNDWPWLLAISMLLTIALALGCFALGKQAVTPEPRRA